MWQEVRPLMGNQIRVPKEVYIKHGVIKFFAKNNLVYYKVLLWKEDGLTQFRFKTAKLETTVEQLVEQVKKGLPSFSSVGEIEN